LLSGSLFAQIFTELLARDAMVRFSAKGMSMWPFIKENDILTVVPCKDDSFGLGEVVAFLDTHHNNLTVHRIVGSSRSGYMLKGDCCSAPDGIVARRDILGRLACAERKGKRVRLSLGRDSFIFAILSRMGVLRPLFLFLWQCRICVRKVQGASGE